MAQNQRDFDPEEFKAQGEYLWRIAYPVLIAIFYIILAVGWIFIDLKTWGTILAIIYMFLGLTFYQFIEIPLGVLSKRHTGITRLVYSEFIRPLFFISSPIMHLFTIIYLAILSRKNSIHE